MSQQTDRLSAIARSLGLSPVARHPSPNKTNLEIHSVGLEGLFAHLGVDVTSNAHTKRIPSSVWSAGVEGRKAFWLGYVRGWGA
jgi:hypothetical protein